MSEYYLSGEPDAELHAEWREETGGRDWLNPSWLEWLYRRERRGLMLKDGSAERARLARRAEEAVIDLAVRSSLPGDAPLLERWVESRSLSHWGYAPLPAWGPWRKDALRKQAVGEIPY